LAPDHFISRSASPVSYMKYGRNDDYYGTTTISGKEYQLPFLDEWTHPFIFDEATQIAALRTGALDVMLSVYPQYVPSLEASAPSLSKLEVPSGDAWWVGLRCDQEPFNDVNVRRAMMIGLDRELAFDTAIVMGLDYFWPVIAGGPGYIALEDLPASCQELFTYDPVKARQMLADEGYPNGFATEVIVEIEPAMVRVAEAVAGLWKESLNVDITIKAMETSAWHGSMEARDFTGTIVDENQPMFATSYMDTYMTGQAGNSACWSDPEYDALCREALSSVNLADAEDLFKQMFVMVLDECPCIPIGMGAQYSMWWPWVKNYRGERNISCVEPASKYIWIDQDLKEEMGY